jgi:hypothetical protein
MTDFRGNIEQWFRQSDPDYYLFFLKAWIPFNAWYIAELPHLERKDAKIIKELQDNPKSRPRLIIENFLQNSNYDSLKFRGQLAELHHSLESKVLKHNGQRLSFSNLSLSENPNKFVKVTDSSGYIIKAEIKKYFVEVILVDKCGRTKMHFKQPFYKPEELERYNDFIKITDKKLVKKIKSCYGAINPQKPITLVSSSKAKTDSIVLVSENKVYFIKDAITIAKGCIKILYALRCMLFHGEVEPNMPNKVVYEHAYYLLRLILKEL